MTDTDEFSVGDHVLFDRDGPARIDRVFDDGCVGITFATGGSAVWYGFDDRGILGPSQRISQPRYDELCPRIRADYKAWLETIPRVPFYPLKKDSHDLDYERLPMFVKLRAPGQAPWCWRDIAPDAYME